ncbi:MAG: thiamine pyrophosphate-binding protein [Bacillales bacterium]|nr:thiamine pyrophosphate-binding protein [Bacillales bacterium]
MAKLNGGQLIEKVFQNEGVKYIFGIPGGHIYPMMESCDENGIKFIGVRHEMTAAYMAEGWALTTGNIGVCTGTAGPGFTNMVTGIANAACDDAPILCVGGKASTDQFDRNEMQDFNQIPIVQEMTKYARQVPDEKRIPEYFGRAISIATSNTPGPVYLEVPREKMEGKVEESEVELQKTWRIENRIAANEADVKKAAELINNSERPMVIAGGGAFWSKSAKELTEFIEKIECPIFTRNAGRGIVPDYHPLAMTIGSHKHPVCAAALQNSDLIIVIGTRPGFTLSRLAFPKTTKVIRIDINGAEITNQIDLEVGLVGDVKTVLNQLLPLVKVAKHTEWVSELKETKQAMAGFMAPAFVSPQVPIHPLRLVAELAKRVDKDTILVIDGGDTASWGNMVLPAMGPGQLLTIAAGSFGPLGVGMPYAMSAKLAHPDKKVILLTGDGAYGYGAMEVDTCMRYGIKVTTIILNDACWGMIKNSEAKKAGPDKELVGLYLRETHYEEVCKALGGYGELVTDPAKIGEAIDRALSSDKPAVVNVMTDVKIGFSF